MNDELIHHGRFLDYYQRDGWEFVRRTGQVEGVAIVARTDSGHIVLVEQTRKPLGTVGLPVIELPAGLVGDEGQDDDVLAAAQRELIEETGYKASSLLCVCKGPTSAGLTDETVSIVVARDLEKIGPGGGVAGENITVHLIAEAELDDWLFKQYEDGVAIDPKVWIARQTLRYADAQFEENL